jgi:hypothetical protein
MLRSLHNWCTYSPFYGLILRRSIRGQLRSISQDNWPCLPHNSSNLSSGLYQCGDVTLTVAEVLQHLAAPKADTITVCLHTFDLLRDLQSIGDSSSRRLARQAINQWIDHNSNWKTKPWRCPSWNLDILGYRLCNWFGFYEFFALSADPAFKKKLFISIGQQYRYLRRRYTSLKDPLSTLRALKGLIYAGCALPREQNQLSKWVTHLQKCLKEQFDVKFNHSYRHPGTLVLVLRDLIDLRQLLRHYYAGSIDFLTEIITRIAPVIRHFRHGDGELSNFSGNAGARTEAFCLSVLSKNLIDMGLSLADSKIILPEPLAMGYARCTSKNGFILVNLESTTTHTHLNDWYGQSTGIGEFEWTERADRLILCGDMSVYACDSNRLMSSHKKKNNAIRYDLVHEKDYGFVSTVYRIDHQTDLNDPSGAVMRAKRELCITPSGDVRGEDTIKVSQDSQWFIRFLAAPGVLWKIAPDGQSAYLCRVPLENRPIKAEDYIKRLICSRAEQMQIVEIDGYQAICIRTAVTANAKTAIKWAISPVI